MGVIVRTEGIDLASIPNTGHRRERPHEMGLWSSPVRSAAGHQLRWTKPQDVQCLHVEGARVGPE